MHTPEKRLSRMRTFNTLAMGIPASYICRALNKHLGWGIQWRGMTKGELANIYAGTHSDFGSGLSVCTLPQLNDILFTAREFQRATRKRT